MLLKRIFKPLSKIAYFTLTLWWDITKPTIVGVRLLLVQDRSVVLVKHIYQRDWFLPGGRVERGETPEQAARREGTEELGAILGALNLVGIFTNLKEGKTDHIVVFACEDFTLSGLTDAEIDQFGIFPQERLPDGVSPSSRRRIQDYFSGRSFPTTGQW